MNRRPLFLTVAFLTIHGLPAAAPAPAKPALTSQERIDALLRHRARPEPLPIDLPNPFVIFTGGVRETDASGRRTEAESADTAPVPTVPALSPPSSGEVLLDCTSRFKIGGAIILNGQRQISINGALRKEGDTISAEWNNTLIQIRVVHFISGQLTLGYRDAETTLRF